MARLRVGGIAAGVPIARLRIGGISAAGAANTSARLRIGGITAAGEPAVAPHLRIAGVSLDGPQAVVIAEFTDLFGLEPGEPLTIIATLAPGSPEPTSWVWSQISGPTMNYTAVTDRLTVLSPAGMDPGATVEFAVAGIFNGVLGPLTTIEISALPETTWSWNQNTAQWEGARRLPL